MCVSDVAPLHTGLLYLCGVKRGTEGAEQFLLGIKSDGTPLSQSFSGTNSGENGGATVIVDKRNLVHTTGLAHFAEYPRLNTTEVSTLTYDPFLSHLRTRRYAGSPLLRSKGGGILRLDGDDNLLVAGQTFDGKRNSLFVIKYPP